MKIIHLHGFRPRCCYFHTRLCEWLYRLHPRCLSVCVRMRFFQRCLPQDTAATSCFMPLSAAWVFSSWDFCCSLLFCNGSFFTRCFPHISTKIHAPRRRICRVSTRLKRPRYCKQKVFFFQTDLEFYPYIMKF